MKRLMILVLLLLVGWALASEFPDLRRYMKIRSM